MANKFLKSVSEIKALATKYLKQQLAIGVDTETTGLEVVSGKDKMLGMSLASDGKEGNFFFLPPPKERKEIYKLLENEVIDKIFFNGKFDLHALDGAGFQVRGQLYDVMVMARMWDENRGKAEGGHRLKPLAALLFEKGADKESDALKEWLAQKGLTFKDLASVPPELLAKYGANDARITVGLFHVLKKKLIEEEKIPWELVRLEGKVVVKAFEMERRGIVVNKPFLERYKASLQGEQDGLLKKMTKFLPKKMEKFNPESNPDVIKVLTGLGWKPKVEQEKVIATDGEEILRDKEPSVDKYALDAFEHPFSELLQEHRRLGTIRGTFVESILTHAVKRPDGWTIHTNYRTDGAVTGRWSSEKPNLQNQDKKSDVRKAFVPRKGYELWSFDFKQIEPVIFAHHSKSPRLIKMFHDGLDYHKFNASLAFGVPYDKVTKEQRDPAKALGLAIMYMAGGAKAAKMMGVKLELGQAMLARYFREIPEAKDLQRSVSNTVEARAEAVAKAAGKLSVHGRYEWEYNGKMLPIKKVPKAGSPGEFWEFVNKDSIAEYGWVRNSFGRKRRLRCKDAYKGLNALIQSDAGDLLKKALVAIPQTPLLQIHDDLVFELKKATAKKEAVEIKKIMEASGQGIFDDVPIKVSVSRGVKNWGEMVEVKL
jgi:DNA polymerase-1